MRTVQTIWHCDRCNARKSYDIVKDDAPTGWRTVLIPGVGELLLCGDCLAQLRAWSEVAA